MKAPYLMSREEWMKEWELMHPDCSSQSGYSKGCQSKAVEHFNRTTYLSFGVQEWLHNKALNGCSESMHKLEYGYNTYNEVINKAKEDGLLPVHP